MPKKFSCSGTDTAECPLQNVGDVEARRDGFFQCSVFASGLSRKRSKAAKVSALTMMFDSLGIGTGGRRGDAQRLEKGDNRSVPTARLGG